MAKNQKKLDRPLLILTGILLVFGLAVIYSASTVISYQKFGSTSYYFTHQLLYGAAIGVLALFAFSRIDYHVWKRLVPVFVFLGLFLLVLVKIPGIGFSSGGASRWIHLGPFLFQPSELAKIAVVLYVATWISEKNHKIKDFYYGVLPALFIVGLFSLLILWQPDLGSMLVLVIVAMTMLFLGGVELKHLGWMVVTGVLGLLAIIKLEPYRARRLTTFLNPSIDPLGVGYQINQALLAIGSGGWWGYGYGLSRQKYNYLPETMGDSVFAVISEELGFLRVMVIIGLFIAFTVRSFKISLRAPDLFGKMLGIGITTTIIVQAVINMGSILGLLPLTGIPLPFFSYGSSAMIVTLGSIGILLNISRQSS